MSDSNIQLFNSLKKIILSSRVVQSTIIEIIDESYIASLITHSQHWELRLLILKEGNKNGTN